jgi:hypothetical protein
VRSNQYKKYCSENRLSCYRGEAGETKAVAVAHMP